MIFGHFIYFGHFPIEIPIEAEKFSANGRKGHTSKTKTVLKSVNTTEQLVGMSKSIREKNQNKNHRNMMVQDNDMDHVIMINLF